jgi:hypothetical protein
MQQSFKPGYAQTVRLYQGTNDEFAGNFIEITEETGPIDSGTEFVRWLQLHWVATQPHHLRARLLTVD